DGDLDAAAGELRAILAIPFPAGTPEGEETFLDARARLARLEIGRGRLDDAERVVGEGLASAGRDSFFLANLHTVAGELHEARGGPRGRGPGAPPPRRPPAPTARSRPPPTPAPSRPTSACRRPSPRRPARDPPAPRDARPGRGPRGLRRDAPLRLPEPRHPAQ